jgi:pimeloyl-ACP methyl ester carboxylesterase
VTAHALHRRWHWSIVRSATALLLALGGAQVATGAPAAWPIPEGVRTVEVNGYPLAYAEAGTGAPVVFIHGAWVDFRLFKPQSAALSERHRLILVSLRHHYPEIWDGKGETTSPTRHAADVAGMIRALGLGKVHLVGHSMGGAVAVEVARTSPELLRSLVLADPGGPATLLGEDVARQRLEAVTRLSGGVRAQLDGPGGRPGAAAFGWNAATGPGAWDRLPPPIQQMLADNIGTMAAVPDPALPRLECVEGRGFGFPVLLLTGERSPKFYADLIAALRQCRAGIPEPVLVPNGGHNMHIDHPAFFNATLLEFFAKN